MILIKIADFCAGGLPDKVLHFLQYSFGSEKVVRQESSSSDRQRMLRHKAYGSRSTDPRRNTLEEFRYSSGSWEEDDRIGRLKRSQRDISPSPISQERTRVIAPAGLRAAAQAALPPEPLHSGKGRSSGTGLPHLVQLFDELTRTGDYFDVRITTCDMGTTVKVAFSGDVSAVKVDLDIDELNASIKASLSCGKKNICLSSRKLN